MRRGSVTVFCALILIPVISFILAVADSARYECLYYAAGQAADAAADSVAAGYDRELFDRYGILFLNASDGFGLVQYDSLEEEFLDYFKKNLSSAGLLFGGSFLNIGTSTASVTETVGACDDSGQIFLNSVLDFYKYDAAGEILSDVQDSLGLVSEGEEVLESTEQAAGNTSSGVSQEKYGGFSGVLPAGSVTASYCDSDESKEASQEDIDQSIGSSVIGAAENVKAHGWQSLALPSDSAVSAYEIDETNLPSVLEEDAESIYDAGLFRNMLKKTVFNEYLLDYFRSYTDEDKETGLQYELEYIIFGEDSDDQNLKKAMNRLLIIREAMNLLYINADPQKNNETKTMAELVIGWTGLQPLVASTQAGIKVAWSFAESVYDMRCLMKGEKVPLQKSASTWHLDLSAVISFFTGAEAETAGNDTGLDYEGYLRLLLSLSDFHDTTLRAMDVIQLNRRETDQNFLLSSELAAVEFKVTSEYEPLFSALSFVCRENGDKLSDLHMTLYTASAYLSMQ